MRLKISIICLIVIFVGCKKRPLIAPKEFGFILTSEVDKVNSFDSTYTRKYNFSDSIIRLYLTNNDLNLIFKEIVRNGLDKYPINYRPSCKIMSMPCFEYELQFKIDTINYDLVYLSDCSYFPVLGYFNDKRDNRIYKTVQFIDSIVNSKVNVKKLSQTDLVFK
jgi:hypothetical protein